MNVRRALVALVFQLWAVPTIARAEPAPTGSDTDDDDDAAVVPGDEDAEPAPHANGETTPEQEDADEHAHHGHIHHEPGQAIELVAPNARLRIGLAVEPLARFGHDSVLPSNTFDTTIARARLALDAELAHGVGLRIELQVRDDKLGIADLYGRWALDETFEIQAGFLGAPQGLERDTYALDLPFAERSALASLTYDRELGVKLVGHQPGSFWAISITRDAPLGIGGDDPDFTPLYPPGVNQAMLTRSATSWNQAARVGVAPSASFEASLDWTLRFRGDTDLGDPAYEPNGTIFLDARPYKGLSARLGGDAVVSDDHFRLLGEAAFRRDGSEIEFDQQTGSQTQLDGNEWWAGGYLTVGVSPDGRYGPAVNGAPLQWGWELLARVEAMQVKPVDAFAANYLAATLGWDWVPTAQIRIQADLSLQSFGPFDKTTVGDNAEATRFYAQIFALWRM